MRIATRFAIAVHVLALLGINDEGDNTSGWMANSIGVNPVIVRNVTGMLRRASIVRTHRGVAGTRLAKRPEDITMLDIYQAVETEGGLFAIHPRPNPACPVGKNMKMTLDHVFGEAQAALETRLSDITMADVIHEIRQGRPPDLLARELAATR